LWRMKVLKIQNPIRVSQHLPGCQDPLQKRRHGKCSLRHTVRLSATDERNHRCVWT
jgi:hypothetical protein